MKRFATGIILVFGVLFLCLAALVAVIQMQPDHVVVDKSITVAATSADLEPLVRDLKGVNQWSPWVALDPDLDQVYSDPSSGKGAMYDWDGDDNVGAGRMTVIVDEPDRVQHKVEFLRPFESEATATISWASDGEQLEVHWGFQTDANFVMKAINLVMPFEETVGADYIRGLGLLKPLVEEAAAERIAAEEAAAEVEEEEGDEPQE